MATPPGLIDGDRWWPAHHPGGQSHKSLFSKGSLPAGRPGLSESRRAEADLFVGDATDLAFLRAHPRCGGHRPGGVCAAGGWHRPAVAGVVEWRLRAGPWRNGRRSGLKIRGPEGGVRVRIPPGPDLGCPYGSRKTCVGRRSGWRAGVVDKFSQGSSDYRTGARYHVRPSKLPRGPRVARLSLGASRICECRVASANR